VAAKFKEEWIVVTQEEQDEKNPSEVG